MATALQPAAHDHADATRARLIEAASHVFAEHGFRSATIREICTRAGANVAAVNYYFRDKAGLYLEVLRHSMDASGQMEAREAALHAATPEEALRLMIGGMLRRMYGGRDGAACHLRIMAHEMAQPTDALPRVVEEIIEPNCTGMRNMVARLLGKTIDDDVTRLCVHSIVSQIVHYAHARPVISLLWPELTMTPEQVERIAAHIAAFSLHGIEKLKDTSHE